jgi:hypothetical protein
MSPAEKRVTWRRITLEAGLALQQVRRTCREAEAAVARRPAEPLGPDDTR